MTPRFRHCGRAGALRSAAAVATALALCGLAAGCSDADADATTEPERAEDWIARTDDDAVFTVDCAFSHRAPDDPIVHPGRPGASHSHDFFGSDATDADSTGESLQGTATTCEDPEDTAAYWVPTLSVRGEPVTADFLRAYYRARPGVDVRDVTAPPTGLAVLSGDPSATSHHHGDDQGAARDEHEEHQGRDGHDGHDGPGDDAAGASDGPDDERSTAGSAPVGEDSTAAGAGGGWGCGLRPKRLHAAPPTDCTARSPLALQLRFPDCWDGEHLDSDDHRSHVARSVAGACPASHPVLMTEVQLTITWPVTGTDGADVSLASGDVAGAHGDFLNGWDPDALRRHVELCIHAKANCTVG